MTPITHTISADDLHKLPSLMRCMQPGDVIVIQGAFHVPDIYNRIAVEGGVGQMRTNQGVVTITEVRNTTPTKQQPNRGPQGHIEAWKRKGRK